MSGKAVIRATQMFTKTGQASRVSVAKEIIIGATLGTALGFYWQTHHWATAKQWEDYYKGLEAQKK